jgi:hypothetical protein
MDHIKVKSSNVASIGYCPETQELQVLFKPHKEDEPGRCYSYAGVPAEEYRKFLNAESVGHYFAVSIRACYESRRIDTPKERHEEKEAKQQGKAKRIS